MQLLTGIDHIQQAIGIQTAYPIAHAGQIGAGIQKTTALLLHDKSRRLAILVFKFIEKHHFGAGIIHRQTFGAQIIHHGLQIIIVFRLARHIGRREFQAQSVVNRLRVLQRNINKLPPQSQHSLITALQFHHIFARGVGKSFVFIKADFSVAVKLLQISQFKFGIFLLLRHHISHQHTKLRAPIADMVLRNHLVTQIAQHAIETVADNAGTQMADVHFFGQIGRRIINHHRLRLGGLAHIQMAVEQRCFNILRQKSRVQTQIDKARPRHLSRFNHRIARERIGHFLRQLTRILLGLFGRAHHAVNLEIAKIGIFGRLQNHRIAGNAGGGKSGFGFGSHGLV